METVPALHTRRLVLGVLSRSGQAIPARGSPTFSDPRSVPSPPTRPDSARAPVLTGTRCELFRELVLLS